MSGSDFQYEQMPGGYPGQGGSGGGGGHGGRWDGGAGGAGGVDYMQGGGLNNSGVVPVYSTGRSNREGGYIVDDNGGFGGGNSYPGGQFASGPSAFQAGGPAYRGNLPPSPLSALQGRGGMGGGGGYPRQQQGPGARNAGYRQMDGGGMRPQGQQSQVAYYGGDLSMGNGPIPAHLQQRGNNGRDQQFNGGGMPGDRQPQQFGYAGGMPGQQQAVDQRRYGAPVGGAAALNQRQAPGAGVQYMAAPNMANLSIPGIPNLTSLQNTGIPSMAQVPYFIPSLHTAVAPPATAPRPMGQMNAGISTGLNPNLGALGQDDNATGYALSSQYSQHMPDEAYMRNLNAQRR
jgi:hypothetical protein